MKAKPLFMMLSLLGIAIRSCRAAKPEGCPIDTACQLDGKYPDIEGLGDRINYQIYRDPWVCAEFYDLDKKYGGASKAPEKRPRLYLPKHCGSEDVTEMEFKISFEHKCGDKGIKSVFLKNNGCTADWVKGILDFVADYESDPEGYMKKQKEIEFQNMIKEQQKGIGFPIPKGNKLSCRIS